MLFHPIERAQLISARPGCGQVEAHPGLPPLGLCMQALLSVKRRMGGKQKK